MKVLQDLYILLLRAEDESETWKLKRRGSEEEEEKKEEMPSWRSESFSPKSSDTK